MWTKDEGPAAKSDGPYGLRQFTSDYDNLSTEEATLVDKTRRVPLDEALKFRWGVLVVSWISVVLLFILGTVTLVVAVKSGSSASFAFALDALLDSATSGVVIWRYSGNGSTLYSQYRESIACTILAVLFLVSGVFIAVRSVLALASAAAPDQSTALWWLSLVDGASCLLLVIAKLYFAYKLESKALLTDAFNTVVGVLVAFSTIAGVAVFNEDNNIWMIDPVVGVVGSLLLFSYGIWIMVYSLRTLDVCKTKPRTQN